MKTKTSHKLGITLTGALALIVSPADADSFGTTGNQFTIDFVNIGNAGNPNDAALDNTYPDYSSPYGGVGYDYRMGTYEISQDAITKATASGLANVVAGAHTAAKPAANMTWYEAAAFVNWLNTSTGHQMAYDLTFSGSWSMTLWSSAQAWQLDGQNLYRHKDAYYFLPSENEWYKAAYHKNDGVTANYWDYATGSNDAPTGVGGGTGAGTAVYDGQSAGPASVNNCGGLSAYGTMGQNGNVFDLLESAVSAPNDSPTEIRTRRGGPWVNYSESSLRSSIRYGFGPTDSSVDTGFRVASVAPEPSSLALLGVAAVGLASRRMSRRCCR